MDTADTAAFVEESTPEPGEHRGLLSTSRLWVGRVVTSLAATCAVVALIGVGLFVFGARTGRWHIAPVLSGSMEPTIPTGAVVVIMQRPVTELAVGDVVVYHACEEGHSLDTVHRVFAITDGEGTERPAFKTKGDANNAVDSWGPCVVEAPRYNEAVYTISYVGYVMVWLNNLRNRLILVAAALVVLAGAAIRSIWKDPPAEADPDAVDESDASQDGSTDGESTAPRADPHSASAGALTVRKARLRRFRSR